MKVGIMATYECNECGMAVNATCAKCDASLVNDMLKIDESNQVQISKCPNNHGKIKSPTCCGKDMVCSTWFGRQINYFKIFYYLLLYPQAVKADFKTFVKIGFKTDVYGLDEKRIWFGT